ncbi:LmrA/YxaF family transcription factor [Mycobacteroides abscessus]|uniref:LmrA/YxaF family transcription factor n=1 Tax=Mycobacteroides abscessus TaxID=36809 RepID=UPI0013000BD7|nr:hypothetical protein [Mycobacteroides abscessus]
MNATQASAQMINEMLRAWGRQGPKEGLAAFLKVWEEFLAKDDFTMGCPIVSAVLARNSLPEAAAVADECLAGWEEAIRANLIEYGVSDESAGSLATMILSALEGATIRCLSSSSAEPMYATHRHLAEVLALHVPEPGDGRGRH